MRQHCLPISIIGKDITSQDFYQQRGYFAGCRAGQAVLRHLEQILGRDIPLLTARSLGYYLPDC